MSVTVFNFEDFHWFPLSPSLLTRDQKPDSEYSLSSILLISFTIKQLALQVHERVCVDLTGEIVLKKKIVARLPRNENELVYVHVINFIFLLNHGIII